MAAIQHRTIDGVMSEYEFHELPNFAVILGREPRCSYEGGDMGEGAERLQQYLEMIRDGDSAATYTVRFYEKGMKVNNKAAYKAGTTFMLSERAETTRDPVSGAYIIDRTPAKGANVGNNDMLLKQLIDNQNKLFEYIAEKETRAQNDAIGKLIGLYEQKSLQAPEKPDVVERLVELGKVLIDKPEIIDRIGYIFRPSIYQAIDPALALPPQNVNGISNQDKPQEMAQSKFATMTEDQTNESIDNSISTLVDKIGLDRVAEALEKIAEMDSLKLKTVLMML